MSIDNLPDASTCADAFHELRVEGAEATDRNANVGGVQEEWGQVSDCDQVLGDGSATKVEYGQDYEVAREAIDTKEETVSCRFFVLHVHDFADGIRVHSCLFGLLGKRSDCAYIAELFFRHL